MKKKLLVAGGAVVGLCVVALVVASFFLGSIVKAGVNGYGPKLTQTRVSLSGASISPLSGSGTLRGLEVGNPKGWSDANLLSFGRVHVSVEPKSLFGDRIVINDIDVRKPEFDYETKLVASNVGDLLATINRATGSKSAGAKAKNGKPLRVEVRHLRVSGGVVRLGASKAAVSFPLPPIELSDIGTKNGGVSPAELVSVVMRAVRNDIVQAAASAASVGKAGAKAANEAAQNATNQAVQGAKDKVKGLLGGKK